MTTTATRERPILFSGPMVKAILDGRKTQTRRIIKPQPVWIESSGRWHWIPTGAVTASREWWNYMDSLSRCSYGGVGDRLWVRETWGLSLNDHGHNCLCYRADGEDDERNTMRLWSHDRQCFVIEETDEPASEPPEKWTSSIHMPRWASRITLEITDVRVQRLMDISEQDAIAEGCKPVMGTGWDKKPCVMLTARDEFEVLWNKINGPVAYYRNPWVWAVTFKRVTQDLR